MPSRDEPPDPSGRQVAAARALERMCHAGERLREHGLRAKKHFGQNFLHDRDVVRSIAEASVPVPGGTVVEIGAGLGALTAALLERAEHVVAIERDRDLVPVLNAELGPCAAGGWLRVVEADAKSADLLQLLAGGPAPWRVAGNLPYQLTGQLLRNLCAIAGSIESAVTMVQLEVAQRMTASPGAQGYGTLSVFLQAAFDVEKVRRVGSGAFLPAPRVDSAVVRMTAKATRVVETPEFQALVRGAFTQRRKTLRRAWSALAPAPELHLAAEQAGISLDRRGEELSVSDFDAMASRLSEARAAGTPGGNSKQ